MPSAPFPAPATLTDDSATILRFAADSFSEGIAVALVTLVGVRGGAARPLGSQMAVRSDGRYCGFVSGGCVEAAVAAEAMQAIACGRDRQVDFGRDSPYFDIVLPCGGGITLHIHLVRSSSPLVAVLEALEQRQPTGLRLDFAREDVTFLPHRVATGPSNAGFDVGYRPRTRLVIYGRALELEATAKLARATSYDVHAHPDCDAALAARLIDAATAVVLLYHDLDQELPALRAALDAEPFYIGALGSSRTHQRRCQALIESGYREADIMRIKGPIGLFPKARDAGSLAISVLADVAAARGEA
ncbi:XdhC family protein [Thauera sp.]|uniref:XdhC family protein n=1 Tax=Thauera sp. TaxID=1905334 RepID=UPI0039E5BD05